VDGYQPLTDYSTLPRSITVSLKTCSFPCTQTREAESTDADCSLNETSVSGSSAHRVDSHRAWIGEFATRVATWSSEQDSVDEQRLLVTLAVLSAPRSGLVLIEKSRLSWLLALTHEAIDRLLASLEEKHVMRIMESGPYLVISLKVWSAKGASAERENPLKTGAIGVQKPPSIPPPVANASLQKTSDIANSRATASAGQHPAEQARGDGVTGVGSGEEGERDSFLRELGKLIDAPDQLASLKTFCERYDPSILNRALERLRRTPRERIRKNPAALFTYLVKTLNRERNQ
jgi:hypothetical protein